MCGGIASALDRVALHSGPRRLVAHGLYAMGRVGSYAIFGAVSGAIGLGLSEAVSPAFSHELQLGMRWALGLLLIAFALGIAGFRPWRGGERVGHGVWSHVQPLARQLARLPGPLRSLGLGALWGFLPCGMVYGAAAVAALTGSVTQGAVFMTAFGLGTLPAVLSVGALAAGFWERVGRRDLRRLSACAVALCGIWVIVGPVLLEAFGRSPHVH
jgi:sulfite exporter TauE/SafE